MIKGNESDVANIDFELQAKTDDIFLCFYIVLKFKELLISLEPDVGSKWGMDQNVGFDMGKQIILNIGNK